MYNNVLRLSHFAGLLLKIGFGAVGSTGGRPHDGGLVFLPAGVAQHGRTAYGRCAVEEAAKPAQFRIKANLKGESRESA